MQIGWIDFSPQERERALRILNALEEPGSVDELGVGVVRDAMASRLFPGTSTLLTKARYFFLTSYLMKYMEQGHDKTQRSHRAIRNEYQGLERECAEGLLACEADREGIIGRVSLPQGKWVTRGPGEIYWAPLRALGFMRPFSPESYGSCFARLAEVRAKESTKQYDEGDDKTGLSDDAEPVASMWNVPASCWAAWQVAWKDWKNRASISLTFDEAVFLRKQIVKAQPQSLFALLIQDEGLRSIALAVNPADTDDYFGTWESSFHAFLQAGGLRAVQLKSPELGNLCQLGDYFSEFILGCRIAYNMQLLGQEEMGNEAWEEYAPHAQLAAANLDIDKVGEALLLRNHSGFVSLRMFVLKAQMAMIDGNLEMLKQVVAARERYLKTARSKIGRTDLGDFGWRGGLRLPYRFNSAVNIIREIDEAGGFDA